MKKSLIIFASMAALLSAVSLSLSGCATNATPAQIAAAACPGITDALATLSNPTLSPGLGSNDYANLAKANTIVNTVCSSGVTVNSTNLQTLAQTGLPIILSAVQVAGLNATDLQRITLGITVAQTALAVVASVDAVGTSTATTP